MKKILFLHAGAELYGADRILINLVTGLDTSKFLPVVVLPVDGPLVKALKERHIETHIVEYPILRRKYFNLKGMLSYMVAYQRSCRKIYQLFKNDRIDIIHVNTLAVLEGIYLKRILKVKLVWHVHEIITHPKVAFKVTSYLAGHFSDRIIAVSEQVKQHLVDSKSVRPNLIQVIYNGIDTDKFYPHDVSDQLRNEFDLQARNITVGMIGRLNSWKGQTTLLDAMIPLLKSDSNLKLVFVGGVFEGEEHFRTELQSEITQSGVEAQITLKDFRTDMQDVYQLFDVFCLPSTNPDPLPTVVLEAMASGKPVIGFKHGGVQEMVVDGYNGYLVPAVKVEAMSTAIGKLVSNLDLAKRMGIASRQRAIESFSPQQFINHFEEVYQE